MAKTSSFDISTGVDLQEVDNAVNQARKEIAQRYDFKGTDCSIDFDRDAGALLLEADDDYRLQALAQVLKEKLSRRKVPLENLDEGTVEKAGVSRARQRIGLTQGIDQETAKRIAKAVRDQGFRKVQVQIQGDELRVSAPKRDELQAVIQFVKDQDFGVALRFGNYR